VQPFDRLLGSERYKVAENDDSPFADELTPAVLWLGKVEMHTAPSGTGG
jgi:hypothetical protein